MAINIASNLETPEKMIEGLKTMGVDIATVDSAQVDNMGLLPPKDGEVDATATTDNSAPTTEVVPATTEVGDKIATESETVEHPSQETSQEPKKDTVQDPPPPDPTKEPKENRGGTVDKINKLVKKADQLADQLDQERGDKARLQRQLDEVNAKLLELQPKSTPKEPELVRPKRPTRAESEFDEAKYEEAMALYDDKLDDFYAKKTAQDTARQIAETERQRIESEQQQVAAKAFNGFVARRDEGKSDYDDWDDYLGKDAPPIDIPDAVQAFIYESDAPAPLMYYLATNPDVREKLESMHPIKQVSEITRIQDKLLREKEQASNGAVTVAATTPEKTTSTTTAATTSSTTVVSPAKPTNVPSLKTPDAPITPLGRTGSATPGVRSLEKAAEEGTKSYIQERLRQAREKVTASR